jgi:hypothetical protein
MTTAVFGERQVFHSRKALRAGLWVTQILLAFLFGMTGLMKLTKPIADLAHAMAWANHVSPGLIRFIGLVELTGALGLVLPALTRVLPVLTPTAAFGLVVVMALAIFTHLSIGEAKMIPVPLTLGLLAAFVAWGRFYAAPIPARRQS